MQRILDSVAYRDRWEFYCDSNVTTEHCKSADFYTETTERINIFSSDDSDDSFIGFSIWLVFEWYVYLKL